MEDGLVPRLGCYLSGHIRSVLRPSQQYQVESAAAAAEEKMTRKYSEISSGVDLSPFVIETSGVWGDHALDLVTEICRPIAAVTHDARFTMFLRQRLSVAVQHGNVWCVIGTFSNNVPCNQYQLLELDPIMIVYITLMNSVSHFVGCERTVL